MHVTRSAQRVIVVNRDVMLNGALSPTSRLLYATMLASTETDVPMTDVAVLVGAGSVRELDPFLAELHAVGAVTTAHGQNGPGLLVHEKPIQLAPVPSSWEYRHECARPCTDCQECTCGSSTTDGTCDFCHDLREARAEAERDIARWKQQLNDGAIYSLGHNGNRLHRWDCHTLHNPEKGMQRLNAMTPKDSFHGLEPFWQRLPQLLTAAEVRARKQRPSCQLCKPDI